VGERLRFHDPDGSVGSLALGQATRQKRETTALMVAEVFSGLALTKSHLVLSIICRK
jgi:hypothetical protein